MERPNTAAQSAEAKTTKIETVAELEAAHPALVAEVRTKAEADGARIERERIAAIDAVPGAQAHGEIVKAAKADGKSTAAEVALRVLEAEKETRGKQLTAIQGVEAEGGKVKPAPTEDGGRGPTQKVESEKTDEDFKAEYAAGPADINKAVTSEAAYIALRRAEVAGRVRVLKQRSA